jgi:hypothetical protein
MTFEEARQEGRREEAERIETIMQHSWQRTGCRCLACNEVALSLIYDPMRNGKFANVAQARLILDNTVRGGRGHA